MNKLIIITLALMFSFYEISAQNDTLLIDFGNNLSPAPWNNITDPVAGNNADLLNSEGLQSGIGIAVIDPFNNINTAGTTTPDPVIGFPATATGDSFFGNTTDFGGQVQPTGGIELSQLKPGKLYSIDIFASRVATDNRETRYIVQGSVTDTVHLQAASNTNMVASVAMIPDADGKIRVIAGPGPNNNNSSGFYYLGALKVVYEHEETAAPQSLTLLAPNGGEFWQAGKTPSVIWKSENVTQVNIEYSTDEGMTWASVASVPGIQQQYNWTIPNTPSTQCLVRVSADTLSDSSDGVFEISSDASTCNIVVLGSSTAEGVGASVPDSAWVNRYKKAVFQKNTRYQVINLGKGGYTTYHILPTGTPIPGGVSVTIDQQRNVTKALSYDPFAIIVNMPSNDANNNYPVANQLDNFSKIVGAAQAEGTAVWVCTTQPRNFTNTNQIQMQKTVRDSIFARYGDFAIDFWNGLAQENGFILPAYNVGDGVHLNNAGHRLLFERVMAKQLDTLNCMMPVGTGALDDRDRSSVKVSPNPFGEMLVFEINASAAGQAEIRLMDVAGKMIASVRENIAAPGIHTLNWRPEVNLIAGMYMAQVVVHDRRGEEHQSFVLVKK